jgi:hypothetical protein
VKPLFTTPSAATSRAAVREQVRLVAMSAAVGWLVAALVGGVLGRLAMRVLVLTSDDRLDGSLTDDEAVVNELTLGGTFGLVLFLGFAGIIVAWLYLGARACLPRSVRVRAAAWGVLMWSVAAPGVFEPEGFDFTLLTPVWLGVLMFTVLFVAVGAGIAIGIERWIDRYPSKAAALVLPFVPMGPFVVFAPTGVLALAGAELSERFAAVRAFGLLVMAAIVVALGMPSVADVWRILT